MPVTACRSKKYPKGRWRIGSGPCVFTTKAKAERAYRAYLAKRKGRKRAG